MDKQTVPPYTDEELAHALRLGTDEAARRQSALRAGVLARLQAPADRRPRWQMLLAAAIVLALLALTGALGERLPQWDAVQRPLATGTPQLPVVTLTTNIQVYTPALSSVQGITITARDGLGNPLPGDWKASWGVFLGPVSEQGNLLSRGNDYTDTLHNAARALWSFAPSAADLPAVTQLTFTAADGRSATLYLAQDQDNVGFVRVVSTSSAIRLRGNGFGINANPSLGAQVQPLVVEAVDSQGRPLDGAWSVSFGKLTAEEGTLEQGSKASWIFSAKTAGEVPDRAQLLFCAPDGRVQVLELAKDTGNPFALAMTAAQAAQFMQDMTTETTQGGSALRLRTDKPGLNADPSRNMATLPITIRAEDDDTGPVRGTWSASFGLLSAPGRSFSGTTMADTDTVYWSFATAAAQDIPDTAEITFTAPDGRARTLHLRKNPDDPWALVILPEDLDYYPLEPATTRPAATASETTLPSASPSAAPDSDLRQTQAQRLNEYLKEFPAIPHAENGFAKEYRGDWDADGKQDHAYLSDSATGSTAIANGRFVTIAFGNGTRLTADAKELEQLSRWGNNFLLQAADLNGDAKNEIILLIDLGGQGGRGSYGLYPYMQSADGWKSMDAPHYGYEMALKWQDGIATISSGNDSEVVADAAMLQAHYSANHALEEWNQVRNTDYESQNAADIICDIALVQKGEQTVVKICQYAVGMTGAHADGLGYLITTLSWDIQGNCIPGERHFLLYPQ